MDLSGAPRENSLVLNLSTKKRAIHDKTETAAAAERHLPPLITVAPGAGIGAGESVITSPVQTVPSPVLTVSLPASPTSSPGVISTPPAAGGTPGLTPIAPSPEVLSPNTHPAMAVEDGGGGTAAQRGWITMEGVKLPYIVRGGGRKLVPLCVVEKTFLSRYPGPYPEGAIRRPPMAGFYLTTEEVRLLNRFVSQTYLQDMELPRFSLKNMIVEVSDLWDFYRCVSTCLPPSSSPTARQVSEPAPTAEGGWIQINNTVMPYVRRSRVKLVPLSVVRYAAGLLGERDVESLRCCETECVYLNEACRAVGLSFSFTLDTRLIELFLIPTLCQTRISIRELPGMNPLAHARFVTSASDRRSVFVAASVRNKSDDDGGGGGGSSGGGGGGSSGSGSGEVSPPAAASPPPPSLDETPLGELGQGQSPPPALSRHRRKRRSSSKADGVPYNNNNVTDLPNLLRVSGDGVSPSDPMFLGPSGPLTPASSEQPPVFSPSDVVTSGSSPKALSSAGSEPPSDKKVKLEP